MLDRNCILGYSHTAFEATQSYASINPGLKLSWKYHYDIKSGYNQPPIRGTSVDNDRESAIQLHLQEWLETLECRLANPKNNWKRLEEIQSEIDDAKKRLAVAQRRDKRYSSRRS